MDKTEKQNPKAEETLITFRIPKQEHQKLKMEAVKRETSMSAIIKEAIKLFFLA